MHQCGTKGLMWGARGSCPPAAAIVVMVAVGSWSLGHISIVGIVHWDVAENSGLEWGTWLNIVFNLVDVKHQTNHPDDMLHKIRSYQAKIAGRLTAKIGEYFNRGNEVL
jgi:hypothetical protein